MSLDEFLDATMFASIVIALALAFLLAGLGHFIVAVFRALAWMLRSVSAAPKRWTK